VPIADDLDDPPSGVGRVDDVVDLEDHGRVDRPARFVVLGGEFLVARSPLLLAGQGGEFRSPCTAPR
jgi:hypothetical protein